MNQTFYLRRGHMDKEVSVMLLKDA